MERKLSLFKKIQKGEEEEEEDIDDLFRLLEDDRK